MEKVHRVVEAFELESATSIGWQLKQVLPETAMEVHTDEVANPSAGQMENGMYSPATILERKSYECTKHRYLLVKGVDTIVAELQATVVRDEAKLEEANEAVEAADKGLKAAKTAADSARSTETELRDRIRDLVSRDAENVKIAKAANKQKVRYETMLDTVRQEIGTQEMRRILVEAEEQDDGQSLDELLGQVAT